MYEITVERRFTAAHRHRLADGGDGLHGHDFLVRLTLAGAELVDDVLVDFHDLEVALARLLAELDHRDLGTHPDFAAREPTPATLARWIFERLAPALGAGGRGRLRGVEVRDTERSGARWVA